MKQLILIVAVLALLGLTGCGSPSAPEATNQFCASLEAFDQSLEQLQEVTPSTTVGELRSTRREVADAWQQVSRAARNLAEARIDAIQNAWNGLERTIRGISNRDTLAEAAASVSAGAAAVRTAIDDVGDVACPDLVRSGEADQAAPSQTIEPALPTALPAEATAPLPATSPATGIYTGQAPPSNGSAQTLTLTLHPDGTASMVFAATPAVESSVLGASEAILEGTWIDNGDETVTVTLDRLQDGAQLTIAESFTFTRQEGQLVAVEYDTAVYGASGLTLQASGVAAAATAQDAAEVGPASAVVTDAVGTESAEPVEGEAATLTGTVWLLQEIKQGDVTVGAPPDPSLYSLTMAENGTANATAECNAGAGPYQVDGNTIRFAFAWSDPMCPQSTLARQYVKYLEFANAFQLRENTLIISYSSNSGQMLFAPAGQ